MLWAARALVRLPPEETVRRRIEIRRPRPKNRTRGVFFSARREGYRSSVTGYLRWVANKLASGSGDSRRVARDLRQVRRYLRMGRALPSPGTAPPPLGRALPPVGQA